jgi:hypothetical protein
MIHIRVVYKNLFGPCGWTTWLHEVNINESLASKNIPQRAWVWIEKGNRFDRYLGYQEYKFELTA